MLGGLQAFLLHCFILSIVACPILLMWPIVAYGWLAMLGFFGLTTLIAFAFSGDERETRKRLKHRVVGVLRDSYEPEVTD